VKRALRNPETAAAPELSIAALGRSSSLADAKKRLAQLAGAGAPLLLRGERGMRAELFARLLAAPGAPFLAGGEMLSQPPSELLGKAAGGILFIADLSRLGHAEQRNLEFLLPRAEKHRVRLVSFSPLDARGLAEKCDFDP
jgi:two-component system nitrogen regulation response regulator NtrX